MHINVIEVLKNCQCGNYSNNKSEMVTILASHTIYIYIYIYKSYAGLYNVKLIQFKIRKYMVSLLLVPFTCPVLKKGNIAIQNHEYIELKELLHGENNAA